ncbi:MAG: hypothetical protein ACRDFS_08900, partial [Chloroflexota bacterium]
RVLPVPHCGWSDLGTPKRVAAALHQLSQPIRATTGVSALPRAVLSLAAQQARLEALHASSSEGGRTFTVGAR